MFHSWLIESVRHSQPTTVDGKGESEGLTNDATANGPGLEKAAAVDDVPFAADELTKKLTTVKLEDRE
jgi:hypothetical protein